MAWNFITGKSFRDMADFTFSPSNKIPGDYDQLPNTLDLSKVVNGSIVYTHGFYVTQLFVFIRNLDKKVIVVTHNSDTNITDNFIIPYCVDHWFAQNVQTLNPKVSSIPIGLENEWWFVNERKKEKMLTMLQKTKSIRNIVFVNFSRFTNPRKRIPVYQFFETKQYATCKEGVNGHEFDDYLDNVYNHMFVACPEGNGIDTHRTWESLYMNTIPIEKRNLNNVQYEGLLPICFVNDWNECTEDFLISEYKRIKSTQYRLEALNVDYWITKIREYAKSKSSP